VPDRVATSGIEHGKPDNGRIATDQPNSRSEREWQAVPKLMLRLVEYGVPLDDFEGLDDN